MKSFAPKPWVAPQPVLIIGTYDKNGVANAMNAAWGGQWDMKEIIISMGSHATTENLTINGEFTVAFATVDTLVASDFVGIVLAKNDPKKMEKTGWNIVKAEKVNAPVFSNFPMTLECRITQKIDESETGYYLVAEIVNILVDENYLAEDGNPDVEKMQLITFDPVHHGYIQLGKVVGEAFSCGKQLRSPNKIITNDNIYNYVKFLPWIGKEYNNGGIFKKRILVLGESFYCSDEEVCEELTTKTVKNYLDIRNGEDLPNKGNWTNTYLKFERSLVNKQTDKYDSEQIWNSIAFFNYLQVNLYESREAGKDEDYIQAQKAFIEVINQLKPELIIVWGTTRMYDSLPSTNWEDGEKYVVEGYPVLNGRYILSDGNIVKIIFVYHPSTGYSWEWWYNNVISRELI